MTDSVYAPLGALGVALALKNYKESVQRSNGRTMCSFSKKSLRYTAEADWQTASLRSGAGYWHQCCINSRTQGRYFIFPADSLQNSLGRPIDRLDVLVETFDRSFYGGKRLGMTFLREG
jgi:hypothetical protein